MRKFILALTALLAVSHAFSDAQDNGDDTGSGATPLTISTNLMTHGSHTLATNDLADWFSFELVADKRYRFESTGAWDVDATLYSDTGGVSWVAGKDEDTLDADAGVGLNFEILFVPSVTQTYYLKVDNFYGGFGEYTLAYQEESIYDDWDPVDDVYSNAPTLTMTEAEQTHGVHNLSTTDTEDWFHFQLIGDVEYTFRAVNGGWDTVGELYTNNFVLGDTVADGDDDYDEEDIDNKLNFIITYTPPVSGDYYLRVIGFAVGDLNYSLVYNSESISDSDGDGMPDTWEIAYFGSTNALPEAHGDADLFSNLDEFIAGTDPTNSASYFSVSSSVAGNFIVEWPPADAGREYEVMWTEHLTNSFQPLGTNYSPQSSYTDTVHSTETEGFYKVKVKLQ